MPPGSALGALIAALAAPPPCAGLPPGDARFIIVGRNTPPPDSALAPLEYADDDARSMYGAAVDQLCFRPDQITLLVGEDATAEGVLDHLARHAGRHPGRLFVYVSAHGSRGEGIQLDRPLSWERLHDGIDAVEARQTFVFLDTCDSTTFVESRSGRAKGRVQIAPRVDEGRFHLTAGSGRAFERHWLRGGVATRDFLSIVYGHGSADDARVISSNDVCRILGEMPRLSGQCEQRIKGGEGVILVPDRRPPGWLQVDEGARAGQWSYLLGAVRAGDPEVWFPIRSIDLGGSNARRADGLPPGEYRLRRIHSDRRRCDIAGVTIAPGETTTVSSADWTPDRAHCAWIEEREKHVPARPERALALAFGLMSHWIESAAVSPGIRVEYQDHTAPGYRAGLGLGLTWLPSAADPDHDALGAIDVAATVFWDPFHGMIGAFDLSAGLELGAGWSWVEALADGEWRDGPIGSGAVRVGGTMRLGAGLLLDVIALGGVRPHRAHGEVRAGLFGGLSIGGAYGID